jgi:serine/threonine protein phosphatase PrpC
LAAPGPNKPHNKAGSCAIMIMVINDDVYILNVGDSRALASISEFPTDSQIYRAQKEADRANLDVLHMEATSCVRQMTHDHKPSDPNEFYRILQAGGHVYQTQTVMKNGMPTTQT